MCACASEFNHRECYGKTFERTKKQKNDSKNRNNTHEIKNLKVENEKKTIMLKQQQRIPHTNNKIACKDWRKGTAKE